MVFGYILLSHTDKPINRATVVVVVVAVVVVVVVVFPSRVLKGPLPFNPRVAGRQSVGFLLANRVRNAYGQSC